jgi:hypothetical protein
VPKGENFEHPPVESTPHRRFTKVSVADWREKVKKIGRRRCVSGSGAALGPVRPVFIGDTAHFARGRHKDFSAARPCGGGRTTTENRWTKLKARVSCGPRPERTAPAPVSAGGANRRGSSRSEGVRGRKKRGRQRPPQLALGLPPPLERRKEYYEQVIRVVLSITPIHPKYTPCFAGCQMRAVFYGPPANHVNKRTGGRVEMALSFCGCRFVGGPFCRCRPHHSAAPHPSTRERAPENKPGVFQRINKYGLGPGGDPFDYRLWGTMTVDFWHPFW